jgi:hypothetical protein
MSLSKPATFSRSTILRILGICVFLVAFVLPACRLTDASGNSVPGWWCALMSFDFPGHVLHDAITHSGDNDSKNLLEAFLCLMSGCINLMIPVYVWLAFKSRAAWARRRLAAAILVCIVATWGFFLLCPLVPLIGHLLWVLGIFLLLTKELPEPHQPGSGPSAA